jgi:hypothetical protein
MEINGVTPGIGALVRNQKLSREVHCVRGRFHGAGTTANNCAPNSDLPCSAIAGRCHCESIRANNTPQALARYGVDCATLIN